VAGNVGVPISTSFSSFFYSQISDSLKGYHGVISQYFFQIVVQKRSQQIRISFYTLFSISIGKSEDYVLLLNISFTGVAPR